MRLTTNPFFKACFRPGARKFEFGDKHESVEDGEEWEESVVLTDVRTLSLHRLLGPLLAVNPTHSGDVTRRLTCNGVYQGGLSRTYMYVNLQKAGVKPIFLLTMISV